jgi:hypothetical protein
VTAKRTSRAKANVTRAKATRKSTRQAPRKAPRAPMMGGASGRLPSDVLNPDAIRIK